MTMSQADAERRRAQFEWRAWRWGRRIWIPLYMAYTLAMLVLARLTRKWIFGASWATNLIVGIKMYGRHHLEASGWGDRGNFSPCSARNKKVGASPRPGAPPHNESIGLRVALLRHEKPLFAR